jgi:ectoine hydroxylase-related dioxygenase (phytanoyl-CoA dioxygenase family)
MKAGEVSVHHVLTFHGSGPNMSDRPRRSLAVHLVAGDVTAVDDGEGWRHYNLDILRGHGGKLGDPYALDEWWPVVHGS